MIYFTSDLHFNHDKDFSWGGPRGFLSVEENNYELMIRYNSIVTNEDDVYILGDLMLGDYDLGLQWIEQLKGKIHIILGNHDNSNRIEYYKKLKNVVEITYATIIKYGKFNFFLCHYPTITANYDDGQAVFQHLINLHGHTHAGNRFYNENPYMYNVGVDAHNGYPVSIEQVIEDIKQKKNELDNTKNLS